MRFSHIICAAALSGFALAQENPQGGNNNNNNNNQGGNNDVGGGAADDTGAVDASLTLEADAIQTGSANDGGDGGVAADGQALSATSDNNFINFCSGKTLTNGLQVEGGSCSGVPMGDIPGTGNMVSAIIINPQTGVDQAADTTFDISVQIQNLNAGSFTNAQETYYSAPQVLQNGNIVGHTHVTVQDMGDSFNPTQPLDPTVFAFFKGINDDGNGNGLLSATVTGGLPAGNYRVCSMTSASNHQPVLMPVAQRGAQDDCTKFTVGAGGGNANDGNNADAGADNADNADTGAGNTDNGNTDNGNTDNGNTDNGNTDNGNTDNADAGTDTGADVGNGDATGDAAVTSVVADEGAAATSTAVVDSDAAASTTAAADAAVTSVAADTGNNGGNNGGRGGGRGRGRGRKQRARRSFIQ